MMTKVLVYAYCVGVFSSRKIQRRLGEDVAFRVLAAGNHPDFRTIGDFRKIHLVALTGLFEQVLRMALEAGALQIGRVALDGSKVKANASKHKAMSYGRMRDKARQLRDEVHQLLTQAAATDAEEDARYGSDRRGDELPAELQRRETRLKRIREAKRALEARARDEAAAEGQPSEQVKPDGKAQYNFTDPESRIMHGPDGFVQAYNVQVAVEDTLQLIVGHAVTPETNDKRQLQPMVQTIEQQAGQRPDQLLADSGYCSDENLAALADTPRRHLCCDAEAEARRVAQALSARASAEDRDAHRADGAQAADKTRLRRLRGAQSDGRTRDWPDQTGPRLPPIVSPRRREGPWRMGDGVHDAQRLENVSGLLRVITTCRLATSATAVNSPHDDNMFVRISPGANARAVLNAMTHPSTTIARSSS
jgi:hypothetical protein